MSDNEWMKFRRLVGQKLLANPELWLRAGMIRGVEQEATVGGEPTALLVLATGEYLTVYGEASEIAAALAAQGAA